MPWIDRVSELNDKVERSRAIQYRQVETQQAAVSSVVKDWGGGGCCEMKRAEGLGKQVEMNLGGAHRGLAVTSLPLNTSLCCD